MSAYIASDNIITSLGFSTEENVLMLKEGIVGIKSINDTTFSPNPFWASQINNNQIDLKFEKIEKDKHYTRLEKLAILSISDAISKTNIDVKSKETVFILSTTKGNIDILNSICTETQCLIRKVQFRGLHSEKIVKFTDVNEQIFRKRNEKNGLFVQTLNSESLLEHVKQQLCLWDTAKLLQHYFSFVNTPIVISNACVSGVQAIITGSRLIHSGQYKNVVITGVDVLSKFVVSGFQSFQALGNEPCKPYDKTRNGLNLGEGCGTIILTSDEKSVNETNPIIVGSGFSSNDANHISGPSRTGEGLYLAIKQVLEDKLYTPTGNIDYISAHGTATSYNDEMESISITRAGLEHVPVNSFKGYWGHTLGAAGVIESVAGIYSLKNNILFKSVGFKELGVSNKINIIEKTVEKKLNTFIKIASGFGGCNTCLLFYKA